MKAVRSRCESFSACLRKGLGMGSCGGRDISTFNVSSLRAGSRPPRLCAHSLCSSVGELKGPEAVLAGPWHLVFQMPSK